MWGTDVSTLLTQVGCKRRASMRACVLVQAGAVCRAVCMWKALMQACEWGVCGGRKCEPVSGGCVQSIIVSTSGVCKQATTVSVRTFRAPLQHAKCAGHCCSVRACTEPSRASVCRCGVWARGTVAAHECAKALLRASDAPLQRVSTQGTVASAGGCCCSMQACRAPLQACRAPLQRVSMQNSMRAWVTPLQRASMRGTIASVRGPAQRSGWQQQLGHSGVPARTPGSSSLPEPGSSVPPAPAAWEKPGQSPLWHKVPEDLGTGLGGPGGCRPPSQLGASALLSRGPCWQRQQVLGGWQEGSPVP